MTTSTIISRSPLLIWPDAVFDTYEILLPTPLDFKADAVTPFFTNASTTAAARLSNSLWLYSGEPFASVQPVIRNLREPLPFMSEVVIEDVQVDPGMMGLGVIENREVADILEILQKNRNDVENVEPENLLYEVEPEEWMEAYEDLCVLYKESIRQGKTFVYFLTGSNI